MARHRIRAQWLGKRKGSYTKTEDWLSDSSPKRRRKPKRRAATKRRAKPKRWMKKATKKIKKGTLHHMLGISPDRKIPTSLLRRKIRHAKKLLEYRGSYGGYSRAYWKKLRARAQMALNFRKKR